MKIMKQLYPVLLQVLFFVCASCSNHKAGPEGAQTPVPGLMTKDIEAVPVTTEDLNEQIKLNGNVQADETKLARIFALVSGRIQSVNAELGDYVKKGQVLAVLKSTEVAGVTNDLSLAASNLAMAEKSLETTRDLYEGKLATEQDYLNARISYNKARSELNRAQQVASITGGHSDGYVVTAPISGFIISKNISGNSEVRSDNSTELFSVANLSQVWVMAQVYEVDMKSVHVGDTVRVNTLADPGKTYTGKIDKIYNMLDPATRTMQVRISLENPDYALKPEMFATVLVSGRPVRNVLVIPASAVIMDNSRNYVITKRGGQLQVMEIGVIKRIGDRACVSGLSASDTVVTRSQVFIYQALTSK